MPGWSARPALAAAAAILVLVPAGAILVRSGSLSFAGGGTLMLMTSVGEIKQVELADGSRVTLDTSTKLDVRVGGSRRTAHLRYGRARFQIAPGAAPFVIEAAGVTVDSSGGVVDVEQSGERSRVQVLAGAADVFGSDESRRPPLQLHAGETATVTPTGAEQKVVGAPASDWTRGMLQFDATPLADAVELANRYSKRHIIIDGDLGALHVTGAFRAGDTVGLAKALAAAFGLSVQQRSDGSLILSRGPGLKKTGG